MKKKFPKSKKLYFVFGAWLVFALFATLPVLNISCDDDVGDVHLTPQAFFTGGGTFGGGGGGGGGSAPDNFGIELNGGRSESGDGGTGGSIMSCSISGNIIYGGTRPIIPVPPVVPTVPTGNCVISGTGADAVLFSRLDVWDDPVGVSGNCDDGGGNNSRWPVEGPLVITGTLVIDEDGAEIIVNLNVTEGQDSIFIAEGGKIICNPDGIGGTNSFTIDADDNIFVGGTIDCSGDNHDGTSGDAGGNVTLYAGNDLNQQGDIIITGTIDTSGGNCNGSGCTGNGGAGGDVILFSEDFDGGGATQILIAGQSIITSGGDAEGGDGNGGDAGDVTAQADSDHADDRTNIFVTGTVEMNGGSSEGGTGGLGGFLSLNPRGIEDGVSPPCDGVGDGGVFLLAHEDDGVPDSEINANGGDGDQGGNAGGLGACSAKESIVLDYDINARGGNGVTLNGGDGGTIKLGTGSAYIHIVGNDANILANGGASSSGTGGQGGRMENGTYTGRITLAGEFHGNGGDGDSGGNASTGTDKCVENIIRDRGGTLGISSEMNIECNGGDASSGTGGNGGDVLFLTDSDSDDNTGSISNSGNISMNGGQGGTDGGNGGTIEMDTDPNEDNNGTGSGENTGVLNALGGDATTIGGNGGEITLRATPGVFSDTITTAANTAGGTPGGIAGPAPTIE